MNTKLVEKLIKSQFPQWSHLPVYPVREGGNDNRTFHLGTEMSIRLPSAERYAPQVEKENLWLPILKKYLQLPISFPMAKGEPGEGYPWSWSVNRWIQGDTAARDNIQDMNKFARDVARFLKELQSMQISDGPVAGTHNFYRGGSLYIYDKETITAIRNTQKTFDEEMVSQIWNKALESEWTKKSVWIHGDVAPSNLLIDGEGKLCGVIDFGMLGMGDPSCDLVIAWTFFDDESRKVFKEIMNLDKETWDRGRGWALWKALITYDAFHDKNTGISSEMERIIDIIIKDFKETSY